jgi:trk system potassium uptake protein TrkH
MANWSPPTAADRSWRERLASWTPRIHVFLAIGSLLAVAALILEYGFGDPADAPLPRALLQGIQIAVITLFVVGAVLRLVAAEDRRRFLLAHWLDAALVLFFVGGAIAAVVLAVASGGKPGHPWGRALVKFGTLFVAVVQLYLGVQIALHVLRGAMQLGRARLNPAQWLCVSFIAAILVGSGLLMLPIATAAGDEPPSYVDALFTSTSAVCVTGLIVRDTGSQWSRFGQTVILVLIQLGGLGIMTFGAFAALLIGRGLGLRGRAMMQDVLNYEMIGRIKRMLRFVITLTLLAEAIGVLMLWGTWTDTPDVGQRLYKSVFHSISAFCNAGFSLQHDSLVRYNQSWQVHLGFPALIILGGLGFPVLNNLWEMLTDRLRRRRRRGRRAAPPVRLNLHSKLVLLGTVGLLAVGTILLFFAEGGFTLHQQSQRQRENAEAQQQQRKAASLPPLQARRMRQMNAAGRLREAWFQSVTARTAGFNSVETGDAPQDEDGNRMGTNSLSAASQLTLVGLMFIGGSPSGTAGGIKTVTFILLLLVFLSILRRRERAEAFHRTIPRELVRRAAALFVSMLALLGLATMLGCMLEPRLTLAEVLFEMTSALGTVGLSTISTQATAALCPPTKLIMIFCMYVGRLGPLTFMLAVTMTGRKGRYDYPSEPIIIG